MNHRPVSLSIAGYGLVLASTAVLLGSYLATHEARGTLGGANFTLLGFSALISFWAAWYAMAASGWFFLVAPLVVGVNGTVLVSLWPGVYGSSPSALNSALSAVSANAGSPFAMHLIMVGLVLGIVSLACVAEARGRKVLLNPASRWWRQAKRITARVPVTLNAGDAVYELVSHDLSQSGIFVTGNSPEERLLPALVSHVERRDPVEIQITAGPKQSLVLEGEVARIQNHAEGRYPVGLGIRFVGLNWRKRILLFAIIRNLKGIH